MKRVGSRQALRDALAPWRGETIALVPTMGNLHQGHLSLLRIASAHADRVVASIFVNPTQFGPDEDFGAYPRTLEDDLAALSEAACDLAFVPGVADIYPWGPEQCVRVHVPGVSSGLCGDARPGHFDGVATVVTRLLALVGPQVAVFGEKDYQQLLVIRRLVADLGLPIEIIGGPIVREPDGLAMSSRNRYLSADERARAPALHRSLSWLRDAVQAAAGPDQALVAAGRRRLTEAGLQPEYLELRRAEDLAPAGADDEELVALAAAHLGRARLIDNLRFPRSGASGGSAEVL